MNNLIIAVIATISITGCAANKRQDWATYSPLSEIRSLSDPETYENDLSKCRENSSTLPSTMKSAINGAAFGMVVGAIMMSVSGGPSYMGAQSGALGGAIGGAAKGSSEMSVAINQCMASKGHITLNK